MPLKKSKKRKVRPPPPEELFEVEVVTKAKIVRITEKKSLKSSKRNLKVDYEYLVKWVGYTSDDDSWEPEENLDQCGPMLREFWENVDSLNPTGCSRTVGKVISASEEWIAQRRSSSNNPEAPDSDDGASDTSDDIPLSRILTQPKRKAPLTITLPRSASKRQKTASDHDIQENADSIPTTKNVQTSTIKPHQEPIENFADQKKTPPVEHHSMPSTPHQIADSQPRYLQPVQDDSVNVFSDQLFDPSLLERSQPHTTLASADAIVDEHQDFPMAVENNSSLPVSHLNFHGKLIPASVIKVKHEEGICPIQDETLPDELAVSLAYSIADVQSLLPCYFISQKNILFDLQSLEPGDASFETAVRYFVKHRQVVLIPILDAFDPSLTLGHYFVIPIHKIFEKVISEVVHDSLFPLVEPLINRAHDAPQFLVIPLRLSVGRQPLDAPDATYSPRSVAVSYLRSTIPSNPSSRWIYLLKSAPWFALGLNVLNIPSDLLMWLGTDSFQKRFLLWNDFSLPPPNALRSSHASAEGRLESRMMFAILTKLGLPEARSNDAPRVLLIHAESLRRPDILARLTNLKKIYKPAMPMIYFYGSLCGRIRRVEEIYPCGGVVTFTPRALLEGHCYASRLMAKLHEHPLWSSYIIPLTLGILIDMSGREQDTNEHASRVVNQVYKNVSAGYISLITSAPSATPGENIDINTRTAWLTKYLSAIPPSPARARALSLSELAQAQASIKTNDQSILDKISKDIIAMQQQPAIMRQYRRFVVIMGDSEAKEVGEQWQGKDGAEWITISQFDFGDGFFNYK